MMKWDEEEIKALIEAKELDIPQVGDYFYTDIKGKRTKCTIIGKNNHIGYLAVTYEEEESHNSFIDTLHHIRENFFQMDPKPRFYVTVDPLNRRPLISAEKDISLKSMAIVTPTKKFYPDRTEKFHLHII